MTKNWRNQNWTPIPTCVKTNMSLDLVKPVENGILLIWPIDMALKDPLCTWYEWKNIMHDAHFFVQMGGLT